jgi:ribonuclease P protein component
VTVVHLPAAQRPARVAFAINRRVGNAVVRNKVRRRLRAIVGELDRERADAGGLPAGTYLLTVRPEVTSLSYRELRDRVRSGCDALTGAAGATDDPGGGSP